MQRLELRAPELPEVPDVLFLETVCGCEPPEGCKKPLIDAVLAGGNSDGVLLVVELTDARGRCLHCGEVHSG